jgi:hypothetical protein
VRVVPETSLTRSAPARIASLATRALRVSTEIGQVKPATLRALLEDKESERWEAQRGIKPDLLAYLITGITRLTSSSRETTADPGLVDSPPMSIISAPPCTISRPCCTARGTVSNSPPSLKLRKNGMKCHFEASMIRPINHRSTEKIYGSESSWLHLSGVMFSTPHT